MMMLKSAFLIAIVAVAMIGVMVPITFAVTQLTINSLEIYEDADYTRYRVTGDALSLIHI